MRALKFILFLSLIIVTVPVHAEKAKDLQVTASPWPPYVSRSLPGHGVAVTIARAVLERAGYTSSFALEKWPADLEKTRLGIYDIIASIWFNEDRSRDLVFSNPILENRIMFMVALTATLISKILII